MLLKVLETFIVYVLVCALAFDDIFVDGNDSQEMIEQGRAHYQLLREKGNLPRYGTCWKGALEHVEDGCKNLSEDTQSDMALHITNCFLEMSGHETYNCELDKKPNLRSICINSMSDRAFNVYTEFYTHVQNICWFLRGQIWYETISENSFKVGKRLEESAKNQEELLEAQKESLEIQRKVLKHEKMLEEVLGDLYVSTKAHQEILGVLTRSIAKFQTWVIGEVSWFDSILFYVISGLFIIIFTTIKRTASARLPLLLILCTNLVIERFICYILISDDSLVDTRILYDDIYSYVWYCRYFFIFVLVFYLLYHSYNYKDMMLENIKFLQMISKQNAKIIEMLQSFNNNFRERTPKSDINFINESLHCNGFLKKSNVDLDESSSSTYSERIRGRKTYLKNHLNVTETHSRYNLRSSKQNTPDLN
ncbi:uncharacterized protein LOC123003563 [Tribolium madens]|uniref:uncharacterized protein LOC123003563 n=1 Tax=Tribolium madens TaxID=41895 RepID=UPI001CF74CC3|nr:uncharacterized protein LOC123003563 [Tribolium madens]